MAWWPIMNRWWLRASGLWRQAAMVIAAVRHPRTPFVAKLLFVLALLYAADPFDLIPDLIPGLGWLDDLLIVPLLFSAAWRFVPQEVANELRTRGRTAGRGVRRAGLALLGVAVAVAATTALFVATALHALFNLV